ncbi:hypothetical protein [Desertivirga brevis]|uniref:hypothetical protein n=1 Tax=Desertivirga brevis TaxID=2810310 RepID=UPI001A972892|nr:hypothetical protein [Pedobacter sp. SYSU D00873]
MKVENNDLVWGSSGRIGDMLVFKQQAGKTIIAKRPKKRQTPPSEGQIVINERFSEAVQYALGVIKDADRKAVYQAKTRPGVSAYNLALSDYCKAPEIKKTDLSRYSGNTGEQIVIRAIDDFMVKTVRVEILNANQDQIEEGEAILSENNLDWAYTTSAENPDLLSSIIRVRVYDIPGNLASMEYTFDS